MTLNDADREAIRAADLAANNGHDRNEAIYLAGLVAGIERAAKHFDGRPFLGSTWRGDSAAAEVRTLLGEAKNG